MMTSTQFNTLLAKFGWVSELKAYFEGLRNTFDSEKNEMRADVDDFIAGAKSQFPWAGSFPNKGRFDDGSNVGTISAQGVFNSSGITAFNQSVISEGGMFLNNSNQYGGNAGDIDASIVALMDKINSLTGRGQRYGSEFRTLKIKATQLSGSIHGDHPDLTLLDSYTHITSGKSSIVMFIRGVDGDFAVKDGNVYFDGEVGDISRRFTPADGWIHLCNFSNTATGYRTGLRICGEVNKTVEIAMVDVLTGDYRGLVHSTPFI